MGYNSDDVIELEACETLKGEVRDWLKRQKVGVSRLAAQACVKEKTIRRWLDGETDYLHVVDYARLWLAIHPEE